MNDWFNDVHLVALGIKSKKKDFYCLRHTLATEFAHAGVSRERSKMTSGHAPQEAASVYNQSSPIELMAKELKKVKFTCPSPICVLAPDDREPIGMFSAESREHPVRPCSGMLNFSTLQGTGSTSESARNVTERGIAHKRAAIAMDHSVPVQDSVRKSHCRSLGYDLPVLLQICVRQPKGADSRSATDRTHV